MKPMALIVVSSIWMLACTVPITATETNTPPSRFSLTKLRKFYDDKGLNPDAAIGELIAYLRAELAHPSPPAMGIGGGPIDTVYVQSVIIAVMGQTVPKQSLLQALNHERDDTIKVRIMFALVAAGDRTFLNEVQSLLRSSNDNLTRLAATHAFRNAFKEDIEAILPTMRDDTYSCIVFRDGRYFKVYPIRQAAYEALSQARVPAKGWELEVPLTAEAEVAALATVLDDGNIGQSVAVLQAIRKSSPAEAARIAKTFVEANAKKPHLALAIREAEKILGASEDRGTNSVQNAKPD